VNHGVGALHSERVNHIIGATRVWGVNQDTSVTEPTLREPPLVRALAMGREPGVWAGPAQIA